MNGERHALGRAVAPEDNVLALLGQSRRNTQAAKKGFRTLLQGLPYGPRVIITAKLKRYGAAKRERLPGAVRTNCLSPSPEECASPAQDLILQVNGGHIPMQEKDKRSFEALAAIVYRPEKIQAVD
jgi:transposase-like protein